MKRLAVPPVLAVGEDDTAVVNFDVIAFRI